MKKKTKVFLKLIGLACLIMISIVSIGQKYINIEYGCAYYEAVESQKIYVSECKNQQILNAINDVLSALNLRNNIEVYEANIDNAIATIIDGKRVIIIDNQFLNDLENQASNKYAKYLIIAHEIGHILNAHFADGRWQRWKEIEADEFAGSVIQKLDMSPQVFGDVMNLISTNRYNPTHPEWQARMKATINGFCQSQFLDIKKQIVIHDTFSVSYIKQGQREAEIGLEKILNVNAYNKVTYVKNIKYQIKGGIITKTCDTKFYDGSLHDEFKKETYQISIANIKSIKLRYDDPGEIEFETTTGNFIETLQNPVVAAKLDQQWAYFDDPESINDDFSILYNIYLYTANIQKYIEFIRKHQ